MKRSVWPLLCITLSACALAQARPDDEGEGGDSHRHQPTERAAPAAAHEPDNAQRQGPGNPQRQAPGNAAPGNSAPGSGAPRGTPRFGAPVAPPAPQTPAAPAAEGGRNHWGTNGRGGNWGEHRDDTPRAEGRRDDNLRADGRREENRRDDNRREQPSRGFDGDGWQRSHPVERPRHAYQWREYDRFRVQNFRYNGGRYFGRTRYNIGVYVLPRGFGSREWLIGEWLPSAFFFDGRYVLLDYWHYGLYEPPVDCHWLRVGNDALLIDDFNGQVLDAIYDLFW